MRSMRASISWSRARSSADGGSSAPCSSATASSIRMRNMRSTRSSRFCRRSWRSCSARRASASASRGLLPPFFAPRRASVRRLRRGAMEASCSARASASAEARTAAPLGAVRVHRPSACFVSWGEFAEAQIRRLHLGDHARDAFGGLATLRSESRHTVAGRRVMRSWARHLPRPGLHAGSSGPPSRRTSASATARALPRASPAVVHHCRHPPRRALGRACGPAPRLRAHPCGGRRGRRRVGRCVVWRGEGPPSKRAASLRASARRISPS
jgi:hypothetical protein